MTPLYHHSHVFVLTALVLLLIADTYLAIRFFAPRTLEVSYLDVGNGTAALVHAPSGAVILINGGPDASILRELGTSLPFWKRSIAAVISTSARAADRSGLTDVFVRYRITQFLSLTESEAGTDEVERESLIEGQRFDIGGGVYGDVLYVSDEASVVRISYGATSFLFSGDISREARAELVARYATRDLLKSDVYALPHEGAEGVVDAVWLSTVRPRFAVISVGAENRYGYPDEETLSELHEARINVLRTDLDNRVVFISDGTLVRQK